MNIKKGNTLKSTMSINVLIAEDDHVSRRMLEKTIKEWGYRVIPTKNGEEAWDAIKKDDIRLAILDWIMPGIDGLELCRRIRQKSREKYSKYTYIILLTGKDQQEDIIEGLTAGADDYLIKPPNYVELKIRLQNGRRIIELEESRLQLSLYDSLTNLWNRSKIFEFFEEELERSSREKTPVGAIMVDVDNFKNINDSYGHFTGDTVLCEVASCIKKSIRRYDKVGRYGGDEMLVILPDCSFENVVNIAERLRLSICKEKINTQSGPLKVTISIGGASSGSLPKSSWNNLIQNSDRALYLAKKQGRNCAYILESLNKKPTKNK